MARRRIRSHRLLRLIPRTRAVAAICQPSRFVQGDVRTNWTDRNIIPYYKGTWARIRRVGGGAEHRDTISFKSRRYDRV